MKIMDDAHSGVPDGTAGAREPGAHTPGPWVQFADGGKTVAIMPAMREGTIAAFEPPYPTDADCHLIAAAPDLLAALKQVVGVADRKTDEFDAARAAIAKASGARAPASPPHNPNARQL